MSGFSGNLHLVLLAGGKGMRARDMALENVDQVPKQFRQTRKGLLFIVSLASFLEIPEHVAHIASVTVAVPEPWREEAATMLAHLLGLAKVPFDLAPAGSTRTQSTWNALTNLAQRGCADGDLVAIHDAARPFADAALLTRLVEAAAACGGAVPGVPVADTIVQLDGSSQAHYLDRSSLLAVQTPQVFRWDILHYAHAWASYQNAEFTDDGSLLADRGYVPAVVAGDVNNWKVTTDADWKRAHDLLD